MNILFSGAGLTFTDHLPLGESLIAFNFAKALADRGHDITVWSPQIRLQRDYPGITTRSVGEFPFYPAPAELRYDWYEWRYAKQTAKMLARETKEYDIIHHLMPFDVARGYSLLARPPEVIGPLFAPWEIPDEEYGERGTGPRNRIAAKIHWRLVHAYARWAEKQCAATYARTRKILLTQARVREYLPTAVHDRTEILPVGVAVDHFTPLPQPVDEPVLLFLAYLVRRKGLHYLLQAMPRVWERHPGARLIIVGAGPDAADYRRQVAAMDHGGNVTFAGRIDHAATRDYFRRAAVYVIPSLSEPFGLSILEAMACGLPVVGFAAGSVPGIISSENHGWLATPGATDELAEKIHGLLADADLRRRLGRANRDKVEREYAWPRLAGRLERIYEAVRCS